MFFQKLWVEGFLMLGKIPMVGPPFLRIIAFLLTSIWKNFPWEVLHPLSLSPLPPVCIEVVTERNRFSAQNHRILQERNFSIFFTKNLVVTP